MFVQGPLFPQEAFCPTSVTCAIHHEFVIACAMRNFPCVQGKRGREPGQALLHPPSSPAAIANNPIPTPRRLALPLPPLLQASLLIPRSSRVPVKQTLPTHHIRNLTGRYFLSRLCAVHHDTFVLKCSCELPRSKVFLSLQSPILEC